MDLKSMLNDSAQRPPSLHTPHHSYDARAVDRSGSSESHSRSQSHSHTQPNRPVPYPPPLQPVDSRGLSTGGGYFNIQSPHPNHLNSASTHASSPSAGPPSVYARSPGGQPQSYTPRDSAGPPSAYNQPLVPSPSLSVNQPPTPGSTYQHQNHTPSSVHSQSAQPSPYAPVQSPRGPNPMNGQPRHISPSTPHAYPQPVTPLGPPISYNKISPSAQRPPSQGIEQHYRKSSYGSDRSAPSGDINAGLQRPVEITHRQSNPDLERVVKERERSVSVSPKTIPQPSPYSRQMSIGSQTGSQGRPSIQSPPEIKTMSNISEVQLSGNHLPTEIKPEFPVKSEFQSTPTPRMSAIPAEHPQPPSRGPSLQHATPEATNSPAPPPNLKRNASVLSDQSHVSQTQPRKRLRRDDIPLFAQNGRTKALRFVTGGQRPRPQRPAAQAPPAQPQTQAQPQSQSQPRPQQHQQPSVPVKTEPPVLNGKPPTPGEFRWESSIANITPFEDLTRRVCDWIYAQIGLAEPPAGGAMFEIEAKIGEIFDFDQGQRIQLPVDTETIFNREKWTRTKFESSMNIQQHQLLNNYLNELTQQAFVQAQKGERSEILYDHPHEVDEFFELTQEGRQMLNPSILEYLNPRHKPRVRRTKDGKTGQLKAQIIKSRIADLEIYNPNTDFDCRISISIESPWEGDLNWLIPMSDGSDGRQKDRMSYRHMAYQVDLTQVSHKGQSHMEHELEVEISTDMIRRELDNLRHGRPSRYEDLVKGLIDNVRLLCRKGSVVAPRRG